MTISVIITTYNRAHLLVQTVESVLRQTRPADELWIVDDGSTDTTSEVAQTFAARGVRYVRQENAYLSAARNTGFAHATGDALLFLDDDDLLLPDALSRLETALVSRPTASLAYCRAQTIDPEGNLLDPLWTVGNEAEKDLLWEALVRMNFIRSPGCALIKRSVLPPVPWDTRFRACEDWDLWLQLASPEGAEFVRVPEVLFAYRIQSDSMSASKERMYRAAQEVYRKHLALYAPGSPRHDCLTTLLAEFPPLPDDPETAAQAISMAPKVRALSLKHRLLRGVLEYSGIAPLYRRLPIGIRLRLRDAFGIKRWAG